MNPQPFTLQPFPGTRPLSALEIVGSIARCDHTLTLHYELRGELGTVVLPGPAEFPRRSDRLWEGTCFEFFLAPASSSQYWEFNLSPAGPWNVYAFRTYRQGMKEEPTFAALPFSVQRKPASLLLTLNVDLSRLIPVDQALDAAISAVIKNNDGGKIYWALHHPGPHPDFHRRDAFIIKL